MKFKNSSILLKSIVGMLAVVSVMSGSMTLANSGQREQTAAKVAQVFLQELGAAMKREMSKGRPMEAITMCSELAPEIANRLSRENGWRVTRVGTRVRNPLLGMPDAWEQKVLGEFDARATKGEALAEISYSEVVSEPSGKYFRFMKPIAVQPKCLLCHGPTKTIPQSIKNALTKHYPFDAATGYKAGDLRGAVSIKQPLRE